MEHPLLCNTQVVRNILAGRQNQDRRPMKPQPEAKGGVWCESRGIWRNTNMEPGKRWKSPFGKPGDVLYCRESWWAVEVTDIGIQYCVFDDEIIDGIPTPKELRLLDRQNWRWGRHPNIHMPKKHSRLRLTVKRAWVERVQDISEADCLCEGIEPWEGHFRVYLAKKHTDEPWDGPGYYHRKSAKVCLNMLWNSLYPGSWDRNDHVFACEFEK